MESQPVKAGVNGAEDQVRSLETASQDPELTSLVSPVIAASFGVIPVRQDPGRVTLATFPRVNPTAMGLLEEVLGATILPVPFEEGVMAHYLSRIFLKGTQGINFQTFLEEDFLIPSNLQALTREKKDDIRGRCHLPEDQIVVCDLSYRSILHPLDGPEGRMVFETGSLTPAYRKTASRIYVDPDAGYSDETILLVRQGYSCRGAEFSNGFRGGAVSALPHIIHPSEMQIARIGSGGAMTFFIYDRMETVRAGKGKTWSISYHYLSFGRRYRRDLTLRLNEHRPWPRGAVHPLKSDPPLRPADLRRWFGHDWDDA